MARSSRIIPALLSAALKPKEGRRCQCGPFSLGCLDGNHRMLRPDSVAPKEGNAFSACSSCGYVR